MQSVRGRFYSLLLRLPLATITLIGASWGGYRYYLLPRHVAPSVASSLEKALGGRVQIADVEPGLEKSKILGLKVFEKGASSGEPLFEASEVEAEISSVDVMRGLAPKAARIKGGILVLQFDAANKMLTNLPRPQSKAPMPTIVLEDGKVILKLQGRADFEVNGVAADIRAEGSKLVLKGTCTDPLWGEWDIKAESSLEPGGPLHLELTTPRALVTQAKLDRISFVPPSVWQQVSFPIGSTPVRVALDIDPIGPKLHYLVQLEPSSTTLHISSIDLHATEAEGKVEIEDKVVRLRDVKGKSADGIIKVQGTLDFQATPSRLAIDVEGDGLDLAELPVSWNIPTTVKGRLTGKASLDIRIVDGKALPAGDGKGNVIARVGPLNLFRPIPIRLHADGKRLRFSLDLLNGRKDPRSQSSNGWLFMALAGLVQERAYETKVQLKDVDVRDLSKALGLATDLPITGKVSTDIVASVPLTKIADRRAYRYQGSVQSKVLRMGPLVVEQAEATLSFRDGKLSLMGRAKQGSAFGVRLGTTDFSVALDSEELLYEATAEVRGGRAIAKGQLPLGKAEAKACTLRVERLPLERLFAGEAGAYPLWGVIQAEVAYRHAGPEGQPVGTGWVQLDRLRNREQSRGEMLRSSIVVNARDSRFRVLSGSFCGGQPRGQLVLGLAPNAKSWFNLSLDRANPAQLLAPLGDFSSTAVGAIQCSLRGQLDRESYGSGELAFSTCQLGNWELTDGRAPFSWSYIAALGRGQIDISEAAGQIAGGRLTGRGSLGWGSSTRLSAQAKFSNLQLRSLARMLGEGSRVSQGFMTGKLELTSDNLRSIDDLQGRMDATFQQAQILELPVIRQIATLVLPLRSLNVLFPAGDVRCRLSQSVLRFERIALSSPVGQIFAQGTASLSGRLNLDVTANTTPGSLSPGTLLLLTARVPRSGPVPIPVLNEVSALLANRLLHVRVTGTARSPVVRIEPFSLLTEDAARFLLFRAVIAAI